MRLFFVVIGSISIVLSSALGQTRVPWTSSRVEGSPEPSKPFVQRQILPKLKLAEALELAAVPGTGRLLVVERKGKISTIDPTGDAESADEVIDLLALHPKLENAFGVALHPKYRENREIFLCYALASGIKDGTKLSRFKLSSLNPLRVDPKSEEVILTWISGEHNGANIQFGPDGFLYVSTGDAAPPAPPDIFLTGQDTSDLLSSILRIDIDHKDPGLAYRIPRDNPWYSSGPPPANGTANSKQAYVCPEIWAFGLRNPWKMSFDRATGNLWCGDVGWELWEMVYLIKRGGNYGWSAYEASQPIAIDRASPLAPITPPIVAHPHSEAASITGGFVYYGKQFPELANAYVYGDFVTGKIWALWYDGKQITRHEEIADTPHSLVTFGQTDDGELYYLHYGTPTTIHRLERNPKMTLRSPFPRKLSETGVFAATSTLRPAAGVYGFTINSPMWQDGAVATRVIALRDQTKIKTTSVSWRDGKTNKMIYDYSSKWPSGAVLARTLTLGDLAPTSQEKSKRIETQLLHYDGETWNAYSYRWNDGGTDAELVPIDGAEMTISVAADKNAVDPGNREYTWRFHSRAECLRCHNTWNGGAIAFSAPQMRAVPGSQAHDLVRLGLVEAEFFEQGRASLEPQSGGIGAARSVLHANCAHCHRSDAGGSVAVFVNTELLTAAMNAVGVTPSQGGLGLSSPKLIDPGDPWNSVICVRMAKAGTGHMPLIGARDTDVQGLKTVEDWIARMTSESTAPKPWDEVTWDQAMIERELKTVSGAMRLRRVIDDGKLNSTLRGQAFKIAWASPEATIRDIYERFKPDSRREKTLGAQVDVAALLRMKGDAARGGAMMSMQGKLASCQACHFFQGAGRHFGPDLSKIGAQQTPVQILESLLSPSKVVAPQFRTTLVELRDGTMQTGFVSERRGSEIALTVPPGQSITLKTADIKSEKALPNSLMPEGQLQGLTAQEAADLLAYLSSMK